MNRSSLPRHDLFWCNTQFSRQELIDHLQYLEPSQQLRTKYQYQNLMYVTAGDLVSQVTNNRWEDFVRQEIFHPLGMNYSNFSVSQSQQSDNFALPYQKKDERLSQISLCAALGVRGEKDCMGVWNKFIACSLLLTFDFPIIYTRSL